MTKILLYAMVSDNAENNAEEDDTGNANDPRERRLSRIARVVAAYQGTIDHQSHSSLRASFRSPGSTLLAACEMQHRCSSLPQQFKRRVALRLAIHPQTDNPENGNYKVEELAVLDNGIVISKHIADKITPELRALASPLTAPSVDIPVFSVDWRLEVPMGIMESDPLDPISLAPISKELLGHSRKSGKKGVFMTLRHKDKQLELTRDIPVITFGRDPQNDLIFENDPLVSRHHCRIEWRAGRIILTDTSTNGTSVTDDTGKEVLLRKSSLDIRDKGLILLGRAFPTDASGGIRFETTL